MPHDRKESDRKYREKKKQEKLAKLINDNVKEIETKKCDEKTINETNKREDVTNNAENETNNDDNVITEEELERLIEERANEKIKNFTSGRKPESILPKMPNIKFPQMNDTVKTIGQALLVALVPHCVSYTISYLTKRDRQKQIEEIKKLNLTSSQNPSTQSLNNTVINPNVIFPTFN